MMTLLMTALIPTILIEYGVLLLLMERRRKVLWASVVINIITNVPLNLCVASCGPGMVTIGIGEAVVILIEALWYYLFVRRLSQAFIYSTLCNAISFLTGLLLQLLFIQYLL